MGVAAYHNGIDTLGDSMPERRIVMISEQFLNDNPGVYACLYICPIISTYKLTLLKPSTRTFASNATRSSKTTTSQKPILVFGSMVLQGGLTLVAKPSAQRASVFRLYTNGVQMAETKHPKSNNMLKLIDVTISVDDMAALRVGDARQLKRGIGETGEIDEITLDRENGNYLIMIKLFTLDMAVLRDTIAFSQMF